MRVRVNSANKLFPIKIGFMTNVEQNQLPHTVTLGGV
jgi:hypothetical protein